MKEKNVLRLSWLGFRSLRTYRSFLNHHSFSWDRFLWCFQNQLTNQSSEAEMFPDPAEVRPEAGRLNPLHPPKRSARIQRLPRKGRPAVTSSGWARTRGCPC